MTARAIPDITKSWFGWREFRFLQRDMLGAYLAWRERHGETLQFRFANQRHVVFYAPEAVGQVLKQSATHFIRAPRMMRVLAQVIGDSVSNAEGDSWRSRRRVVAPAFQPQRIQSYCDGMVETVERSFPEPGPLTVMPTMSGLTLRLFCAAVLDLHPQQDVTWMGEALDRLGRAAMIELFLPAPLPAWLPIPFVRRKREAIERLQGFVSSLIASNPTRGLVTTLDEAGHLTPLQLRDEVLNLLLAGHETTAAGLSWMLYLLATHPDVAARVAEEGRRLPETGPSGLLYTEQVVKETLRLYPPAPGVFLRQALEDVDIAGYRVPRGSVIHLSCWAMHRDPRYYPDPGRFDPDRFHPDAVRSRPDYTYFPFGGGARICLGQSFALLEMAVVGAVLMRKFDIRMRAAPASATIDLRFSLWPGWPLQVDFSPRKHVDTPAP